MPGPPGQASGQAAQAWVAEIWCQKGNKRDEACGCERVKLLVEPALSSEIHRYKQKKNKKLNIICIYIHTYCLKPNERAVKITLFLFY